MARLHDKCAGQALTELALILLCAALVTIAAVAVFGNRLEELYFEATANLFGS